MAKTGNSLDESTFKKLSRLYIIALSAIAFSVLVSQFIVRNFLQDQQSDSTVVNVAGRQRMLSQKLTKELLLLPSVSSHSEQISIAENLKETIVLWKTSHEALLHGSEVLGLPGENSIEVQQMYLELAPYYEEMFQSAETVLGDLKEHGEISQANLGNALGIVKSKEADYLRQMDAIVNQYNVEASAKVDRLRGLEFMLMLFTLLVLLVEFFFVFAPTAKGIRATIHRLLESEQNAIEMAQEAHVVREENERSVKELRTLNKIMDQTLLFARVASDGAVLHVGDRFSQFFKVSQEQKTSSFSNLITSNKSEQEYIDALVEKHSKTGWKGEVELSNGEGGSLWLEMFVIPYVSTKDKQELLIIASDITKIKKAQLEIEMLTKQRYEEKMSQQKLISSKIIENQEQEQNRIAKDIHDGIGQMLTGLKFNLESIDLKDVEKTRLKIENLKEVAANIILGVRVATFNLTPPELTDYGVASALSKLVTELVKFTGKTIKFFNKSNFNQRLDALVEINIYRITQEAINNAIKYANSTHIIVMLSHSDHILSITVDDDGVGFDASNVKTSNLDSGGMGMTFMRERVTYINGRLFVNSSSETGTRITLNVPI
ncbi:PAS domain-containing sensor histidine kinase [Mangrovimonas xylaniphaga]|uniref:PAS domain-containing sensor histidine kinase n=1 Tax=Mangrovimonas xylaniphaga TaxID=1645915 RepID=UPI0006B5BBC5|nr:type IV pili methyl-accepting chemotaxis transducer N-terminal domain-containing protein [Mangrovimonas xylaniphaga]